MTIEWEFFHSKQVDILDETKLSKILPAVSIGKICMMISVNLSQCKRASLSHVVIPVNCECRMPDSMEEMVACDKCDRWYHFTCAGFDVPPPGDWFANTVHSKTVLCH